MILIVKSSRITTMSLQMKQLCRNSIIVKDQIILQNQTIVNK